MKRFATCLFLTALIATGYLAGQGKPWTRKTSPLSPDANAKADFGGKTVSINYSAPSLRNRQMLDIMKNDPGMPVWRAGAQDATLLHTDADLEIAGLSVPKGEYTLFVSLADPAKWQLIVNKQIHQWGLSHDNSQDLGRVPMIVGKPASKVETLLWTVTNTGGNKGRIQLEWENYSASVPFTVK